MKLRVELQKVYEKDEHEAYAYKKVGLRIDNRIIWFAFVDSRNYKEAEEEFRKMEAVIDEIIRRMCGDDRVETDVEIDG